MSDTNPLLIAIATTVAGIAFVEISKKVADAVVGNPAELEAQKYEIMHQRLEGRQFFLPREDAALVPPPKTGSRRSLGVSKDEASPVMTHIREALHHLELAEQSTKCGVCRKGAAAAQKAVIQESAVIARADSKSQVIQQLKAAGKIPQSARWDMLNPKQKKFINAVAERSIQNAI